MHGDEQQFPVKLHCMMTKFQRRLASILCLCLKSECILLFAFFLLVVREGKALVNFLT